MPSPESHTAPTCYVSSWVWLAGAAVMRGCLLANNFATGHPALVSRSSWLRRVAGTVNNGAVHFISIVKCSCWIVRRSNYTNSWSGTQGHNCNYGGTFRRSIRRCRKHAENPPSATRLLTVNGSRIDSRELFATEREIIISHGEENYRLRLTSQNKLILTK